MLDPPLPWEEITRIAVKIGMAALLIIAWRRHRAGRDPASAEEEISSLENEIDLADKGPRPFYYVLGHVALRDIAMSDPRRFLEIVSGDGSADFFRRVWDQVQTDVAPDDEIPMESIQCDVYGLEGGRNLAVINMPAPERIAEPFFVAVLVDKPTKLFGFLPRRAGCRYFTLELGEDEQGERLAVFCEWQKGRRGPIHNYYGPIQPAGGGFISAIKSVTQG